MEKSNGGEEDAGKVESETPNPEVLAGTESIREGESNANLSEDKTEPEILLVRQEDGSYNLVNLTAGICISIDVDPDEGEIDKENPDLNQETPGDAVIEPEQMAVDPNAAPVDPSLVYDPQNTTVGGNGNGVEYDQKTWQYISSMIMAHFKNVAATADKEDMEMGLDGDGALGMYLPMSNVPLPLPDNKSDKEAAPDAPDMEMGDQDIDIDYSSLDLPTMMAMLSVVLDQMAKQAAAQSPEDESAYEGVSVFERKFNSKQRKALAKSGAAMPDGSFPIANKKDLQNAIHAIGRASNPDAAKAHIKSRAKALGLTAVLPDSWSVSKTEEANGNNGGYVKDPDKMYGKVKKGYFGDFWKQVGKYFEPKESYEMVQESFVLDAEFVDILEKSKILDFSGNVWKICIIKEGWSLNNRYYPKEVLERDKDKFEGVPIAIYGYTPEDKYLNHLPSKIRRSVPEGLAKNTVGWVENVRSEVGDDGKIQLVGDFCCIDEALAGKIKNAWAKNKKDLLGFSIDAAGEIIPGMAEGRKGSIVSKIVQGNEVTLVNQPAAGGKFLRLVASLNEFELDDNNDINRREKIMDEKDVVQENALLDELQALKSEMETQKAELAEQKQAAKLAERKSVLSARLKEEVLPEKAQKLLKKQFGGLLFEDEDLDKAIADIRELLASVDGGGTAKVSQPTITMGHDPVEKMEAELALCFGYDYTRDTDLSEEDKKLYRSVSKKPSLRKVYEAWYDGTVEDLPTTGAGPLAIQESTTATLPTALGNTLGRALFQQYAALPNLWQPFTVINPNVDTFKAQTRILWDGWGGLQSVGESDSTDTFVDNGFPSEHFISYNVQQFGMLAKITRKMIINDDLQMLRDIPRKMSRAASKDLHEFVFGLLTGNRDLGGINSDLSYDGLAIYHANHFNTTTSALSHTSLAAAINALSVMYEYGMKTTVTDNPLTNSATTINLASTAGLKTGQRIRIEAEDILVGTVASATQLTGCTRAYSGTTAVQHIQTTVVYQLAAPLSLLRYHLVYPMELRDTVHRIMGNANRQGVAGTLNNDLNQFVAMAADGTLVPMAVPTSYLGGDQNNWYLVALPQDISCVEVAFLNNRQVPEIFVQDNPTVGSVFTRDNITYKLRHEYGGTTLDWRGLYGALVP